MKIALYYLASPKTGGWVTYIIHLAALLRKIGYKPMLFKIGNKTQKISREFAPGLTIKTICLADACRVNKKIPYMVVAMELKDEAEFQAINMLKKTRGIIIHHGCGQTPEKDFFDKLRDDTIHIGVRDAIKAKISGFGYDSRFVLHPYISAPMDNIGTFRAGSISRVDYVKNTHIIAKSNEYLEKKIHIYGSENRLYTFQRLDEETPQWRDYYFGEFSPSNSRGVASDYELIVDLTRIKNDGGGLQYTFLEAIDCGCGLILHDDWVQSEGSLFKDGLNCKTIKNSNELTQLIDSDFDFEPLIKESKKLMKLHSVSKIGGEFKECINKLN